MKGLKGFSMRPRMLWGGLVLAFGLLLYVYGPALSHKITVDDTATATFTETKAYRGDFFREVQLVAQVESQKQVYLGAPFNAKLAMIVDDGKAVKAGEEIARLETQDIEERLEEKKLELQSSNAALNEHDRNQQATLVGLDAQVQTAQNALALAQLNLKQLQAGTPAEELKKLQLQLTLTRSDYARATGDLALKEKLEARGMSSRLDVLQARLDVARKKEALEVAEARYNVAKQGATPLSLRIARVQLRQAQDNLDWARQEKQRKQKSAALERKKKRLTRDAARAEVEQRQRQLKAATLKAPQAGNVVLTKSFTREGLKQVSVGDEVFEGNPFISVADLEKVRLRGEIDEILLRYLTLDMPVEVRIPSVKGKKFAATLTRIGVLAHQRSGRQNTTGLSQVFDVTFLPQEHTAFAPGTTVDVMLKLEKQPNVLLLDREAVHRSEAGGHHVILATGEKQAIRIGNTNVEVVTVLEGLSEGQTVRVPKEESL